MKEIMFINAKIFGYGRPADSILVKDDNIAAVGSYLECRKLCSSRVMPADCRGAEIIPAFIDSHSHLVEAGEALLKPDLGGMSIADLLVFFHDSSKACRSEIPLIQTGLNDEQFTSLKNLRLMPADGGILIFHSSGHCAIADRNAALKLHRAVGGSGQLVIDEPYEDPEVLSILQKRKKNRNYLSECLRAGIDAYHTSGVTALQDNTWDPEVFNYYNDTVDNIDIDCWSKGLSDLQHQEPGTVGGRRENINTGPAKFFIDGAFFNRTAWLSKPYAGSASWCGSGTGSADIIEKIKPAVARKRQCAFHAAGDRAVSELCDALEALIPSCPWIPELRMRIEHAQLINERDYSRIRRLGLIISAQPRACANPERDVELLGEKRARLAYPHRRILDEGIPLAFGSDFPYEDDFNPLRGISTVCSRRLGESLSFTEAVNAYTAGSAYAGFSEKQKGRIAPGFKADFFIMPSEAHPADKDACLRPKSVYYRGRCLPGGFN